MAQRVGFDLPCGVGRVAALERPRRSIHFRSRSNPPRRIPKYKRPTLTGESFVFGAAGGIRTHVGFRPNGFRDRPVMTASIPLHILFMSKLRRELNNCDNGPPRYVPLRCPKFSARRPLAKFRPLPLLIARLIRPRRRSQTSPLRYRCINFSGRRVSGGLMKSGGAIRI